MCGWCFGRVQAVAGVSVFQRLPVTSSCLLQDQRLTGSSHLWMKDVDLLFRPVSFAQTEPIPEGKLNSWTVGLSGQILDKGLYKSMSVCWSVKRKESVFSQ